MCLGGRSYPLKLSTSPSSKNLNPPDNRICSVPTHYPITDERQNPDTNPLTRKKLVEVLPKMPKIFGIFLPPGQNLAPTPWKIFDPPLKIQGKYEHKKWKKIHIFVIS